MPGPRGLAAAFVLLTVLPAVAPLAASASVVPLPDLPGPLLDAATVYTGRHVYLFGGRDGDGYRDEILRYDATTGETLQVGALPSSSRGPAARQAASAVWSGSKAYVFGGAVLGGSASIPDVVEFDPATNVATTVDALPEPVLGTSAVWHEGKAYVFGGLKLVLTDDETTSDVRWMDDVVVFDPEAPEGRRVERLDLDLPYAAQDMAAVVRGGKVLLLGGYAAGPDGDPEVVSTVVEFDPVAGTAKVLPVGLPRRLQWAAAGVVDGTVWVLGGREAKEGEGGDSLTTSGVVIAWPEGEAPYEHALTLPVPRYAAGVAETPDGVVLLGGRDSTLGRSHPGMPGVLAFLAAKGPPTAPVRVSAEQGDGVALAWGPPLHDGDGGVDGYRLERVGADGDVRVLGRVGPDVRAFADRGAPREGRVVYRVAAFNAHGEGPAAAVAVDLLPRPPAAPRVAAYAGDAEVLLRWSADAAATAYVVERRTGEETRSFDATGTSYLDTGLANGVAHTYRVLAGGEGGASAPSVPVTVRPGEAPGRVGAVAAEVSDARVRLTWPAVEGAAWYDVLRGEDPVALARVANVTGPGAVDEDVEDGAVYWYAVRAGDDRGAGLPSEPVAVARLAPPGEPYGFLALPDADAVRLRWRPPNVTGGVAWEELRYVVHRSRAGEEAVVVASGLAATVHADRSVEAGSYVYTVSAENPAGPGAPSRPVEVRVGSATNEPPRAALAAAPAGVLAGADVTFDASFSLDADDAVETYSFDFGDGATTGWTPSPTVVHAYPANGVYAASVRVRDARGAESATGATAQVTVGPPTVEGVVPPRQEGDDLRAEPPGGTPKVPGPGIAPVAAAAVAAALARRRR